MYGVALPLPMNPDSLISTQSSPILILTTPDVTGVIPAIIRDVVVLPAPEIPTIANISFSLIVNDTPSTAFTTPLTTEK